jgi:mono/diheme cytochrome c family protein
LRNGLLIALVGAIILSGASRTGASDTPHVVAASSIDAGRYLVVISGCNHCHTPGWEQTDGVVPQAKWLTGAHAPGPQGAPSPNLRTIVASESLAAFSATLHRKQVLGVQMPFVNTRQFSDADIRSIYDFIHSLK